MMNKMLNLYFKLPHDSSFGLAAKIVNRLVAKTVKLYLDRFVPNHFLKTQKNFPLGINKKTRDKSIIISFTSFPGRIADVWIVVECLFRQTYKADKIILWLDKEKFNLDNLPANLKSQISRGLEIKFVEDLRSHTKYYYALKEYTDSYVLTVDDDCYYPETIVENLMKINEQYPDSIASNRIHKLRFESSLLLQYRKWYHNFSPNKTVNGKYLLTGVSGVLYPANIFDDEFFDVKSFMEKCMYADDIWLSLNAFRLNIDIASNPEFNKDMISISKSSNVRLLNHNSKGNGNDEQLRAVLEHFGINNFDKYFEKN